MKTITSVVAALALLAPLALTAADFEGTVQMKMSTKGMDMPMTFSLKPGFNRVDIQSPQGSMGIITNLAKQQMIMLMPNNMYMTHDLPKAREQAEGQASEAQIEKTGQHEKILGYDATKYIVKDKDTTTELWMTDELGMFGGLNASSPMGGRGARQQKWEELFRGKDAFPLRVVSTTGDGKQTFKMEATDIKKVKLADSLFEVPAGAQDISGMMPTMPGMPNMGGKRPPRGGGQ